MGADERILLVDDDDHITGALSRLLRAQGYSVDSARDGEDALAAVRATEPDLVITDLGMPRLDGLHLIKCLHSECPDLAIIVLTGFDEVRPAVTAMSEGALDYLTKPVPSDKLLSSVEDALVRRARRRAAHASVPGDGGIVGNSPQMRAVMDTVRDIASARVSVLLTGETGTGKELVAQAIHAQSTRAARLFVPIHCAALAESLVESELFGHERGAFTGAAATRDGKLAQADGGTLFLDEVGDIPPPVQVKLLRFLQDHTFERVGSNRTFRSDVRVISATNRDLERGIREGWFREDLYFRLNVISIELPPLRERPGDVPLLAAHFLGKFSRREARTISGFTDEALEALCLYPWPGNVRELEHAVERAVVLNRDDVIQLASLPRALRELVHPPERTPVVGEATLESLERYAVLKAMEASGGSTAAASRILGITPRTIQYRMQEYAGNPRKRVRVPQI